MKRILFLMMLLANYGFLHAQGASYTPFIPKYSNIASEFLEIPLFIPSSPTVTVVKKDVQVADALYVKGDIYSCDVQVKITTYSNNQVSYEIIGIKGTNNWEYIECPIKYISDVISDPKMPNELKSFLLNCSEFSRFIAIYNEGLLLTGLKEVPTYKLPRYNSSQKNIHYNAGTSAQSKKSPSNEMTISKTYVNLEEGETIKLYAYNYGQSLEWESDDTDIAIVSPQGVVCGVSKGVTFIWAKGNKKVCCRVYVNNARLTATSGSTVKSIYAQTAIVKVGQKIKASLPEGKVTRWEVSSSIEDKVVASGDILLAKKAVKEISIWGYVGNTPKLFKLTIVE